jgi:NAD(P)-dependent dehydrogenase (short-subunit alcohol dehydrogenase family)
MADLSEKSVVITGAGRGLGAAYACAAATAGAAVIVNDIDASSAENVAAAIREAGGRAIAHPCDVRDFNAAEALVGRCIAEFGAITGLVNNAALSFTEPFETGSVERLRQLLEVNVVGVFNCGRAAVGPMLRQRSGSIVNITSGAQAGHPGLSSYGATKGAVASFTYGWAGELRDRGVRVNAISPLAATPMSGHAPHLPPPDVNSPPVLFLLSDRSQNITGQVVRIIGNKLSLMCHPANRAPVLERDVWTLETVADAFDQTLAAKQLQTGMATYDIVSVHKEMIRPDPP